MSDVSPKLDVKKGYDAYQARRGEFRVLEVPPSRYMMIDGKGDPNMDPSYSAALSALYPVAYALKFASKKDLGRDYVVPPLEGLWWADDHAAFTTARDKRQWCWRMMLFVPEWLDSGHVEAAIDAVKAKILASKDPDLEALAKLDEIGVGELSEGLCVQTLHVGSFDEEGPILERMHTEFIPQQDLRMAGTHHEIYLSDPRRTAPEKLRTILRQPVHRHES